LRLLNASGCLDALTAPEAARELDAFVTKTVTPLARAGNAPVRIAETELGMLNAIGLANPGVDAFVAQYLPRLVQLGLPLWVSVGGFAVDDYVHVACRVGARNEVEALMLEFSLIQQHRPRFNVRLRDDKSYPFLAVTVDEQWPRALVMRGRKRKGTRYFGPYAHAYAIRDTLDLLLRSFPIRTCSPAKFNQHQRLGRPCLLYHIEKCSGPCVGEIGYELVDVSVAVPGAMADPVVTEPLDPVDPVDPVSTSGKPEGEIDTGKFMQELEDFLRSQQEGGSGESGGSGSSTDR